MRRLLPSFLVAALAVAGCGVDDAVREGISEASEVAEDARQQIEDTSRNVRFCAAALSTARAAQDQDWAAAIEHGEELVATAPDEIADDARVVLEGARAYRDGDPSAVQSEEFRAAAERLDEFTRETCDPRS